MAAPLGFKTFTTGEVLTAADTNGYLMQGVLVFADAAARTAAITSPQEGQTSYLKDTDVIQVYSGSAWVTKSGSSPLTTKGDLYTYSTTDARLAVGTNGQVLLADSAEATGLKWGTPASGSMTLLSTTTLSGASTVVSSISQAYKALVITGYGITFSATACFKVNPNSTESISRGIGTNNSNGSPTVLQISQINPFSDESIASNSTNSFYIYIQNYTSAVQKPLTYFGMHGSTANFRFTHMGGGVNITSAVTSMQFTTQSGIATLGGTVLIYGVN